MDLECNVVTLEDGISYVIIKELNFKNNTYVFLTNENDKNDFCIRKKIIKDNEECLMGLESEEEFDEVLKEFANIVD